MTDEPEVGQRAEDEVRRLLAAARHDEPTPADVVARIDAALAAEAPSAPPAAPVVDLDARRRRRRRTGLLAAAVVVVAGVGVGAVGIGTDGLPVGGSDSADEAGSSAESGGGSALDAPDAPDSGSRREESGPSVMGARAPLPRVRTGATLGADVTRALRAADALPAGRARCAPATAGEEVLPVLADGSRAELLLGPVTDGDRAVALHPCGDGTGSGVGDAPLATLVVPAG